MEKDLKKKFPRTNTLPTQSPKYWVKEKDRYLRQLMISDIESETKRRVIVYFARGDAPMNHEDSEDLTEILDGIGENEVDLILQTPGGDVISVEKYVSVMRHRLDSYRVIVPNFAKSGGTVICLSAKEILLGANSELGPIDPQMHIRGIGQVPCEIISQDDKVPHSVKKMAENAVKRAKKLAGVYLSEGMLKKKNRREVDKIIKKISSPDSYGSHGSVIDFSEAKEMGLSVKWLEPGSSLWKRIWLLHCMYGFDMEAGELAKIQEGAKNSIARKK